MQMSPPPSQLELVEAVPAGAVPVELPPKLVEGLIQAGFSRERAREALTAVFAAGTVKPGDEAEPIVRAAHDWLFADNKEQNMAEAAAERVSLMWPRTDFDGYAVIWGINHLTETPEECAQRCIDYKPAGASWYACNIWVWCAAEGHVGPNATCFAPAAHTFVKGQCWLKHQDDPLVPHINMQGTYTEAYLKRHPNAPPIVQWTVSSRRTARGV